MYVYIYFFSKRAQNQPPLHSKTGHCWQRDACKPHYSRYLYKDNFFTNRCILHMYIFSWLPVVKWLLRSCVHTQCFGTHLSTSGGCSIFQLLWGLPEWKETWRQAARYGAGSGHLQLPVVFTHPTYKIGAIILIFLSRKPRSREVKLLAWDYPADGTKPMKLARPCPLHIPAQNCDGGRAVWK